MENETFNQTIRRPFAETFAHLTQITELLSLNRIRFLLTNLAITDEFALNFDAEATARAKLLCPRLFPEQKKKTRGQFGATVYFKYILPTK